MTVKELKAILAPLEEDATIEVIVNSYDPAEPPGWCDIGDGTILDLRGVCSHRDFMKDFNPVSYTLYTRRPGVEFDDGF